MQKESGINIYTGIISIVIPVYCTPEADIRRMISSLVTQNDPSVEILMIDDGSDALTARCLDSLGNAYETIHVFHEPHGGVSRARNKGISLAKGEYIIFLDADDTVSSLFLEEVRSFISRYEPDVIFGKVRYVPALSLNQYSGQPLLLTDADYKAVNECLLAFPSREYDFCILGRVCGRVYKTQIARKTWFEDGVDFYEDQLFNRSYIKKAKRFLIVENEWDNYYQNEYSALHSVLRKNYCNMVLPYWNVLGVYNDCEEYPVRQYLSFEVLDRLFSMLSSANIRLIKDRKEKIQRIYAISNHEIVQNACRIVDVKYAKNAVWEICFFLLKHKKYRLLYSVIQGKKLCAAVFRVFRHR